VISKAFAAVCLFMGALAAAGEDDSSEPHWVAQQSGIGARFRGVHAVSRQVVWACGTKGTFARTVDSGVTWKAAAVPGASSLDFRDVHAFDAHSALLLSSGPGDQSRIDKTTDGGSTWERRFTNPDATGFLDAIAFWNANLGLALGDPAGGRFQVFLTADAGLNWSRIPAEGMPASLPAEAAFAASGTCLVVEGERNAWFATGGAKASRVFRSTDGGRTWSAAETPVQAGSPTSGIFSLAFRDASNGYAIGGDFEAPRRPGPSLARTSDGGRTWSLLEDRPRGYRSAIAFIPGSEPPALLAVGPTGSNLSRDDGKHWSSLGTEGFHALSLAGHENAGWAVGDDGRIARLTGRLSTSR
jgi:photosystem II stability/assembly factor-like uncharacterized protein